MSDLIKRTGCFLIISTVLSIPLWAQEIPLTSDDYWHRWPQWSNDGDWIVYQKDDATEYWQIYKTSSVGIEEREITNDEIRIPKIEAYPNPFASFATIPGYEPEHFVVYDVTGCKVGTYTGDRIGGELAPGIYFFRGLDTPSAAARIVKIK